MAALARGRPALWAPEGVIWAELAVMAAAGISSRYLGGPSGHIVVCGYRRPWLAV